MLFVWFFDNIDANAYLVAHSLYSPASLRFWSMRTRCTRRAHWRPIVSRGVRLLVRFGDTGFVLPLPIFV
jgi:hypothetical protein